MEIDGETTVDLTASEAAGRLRGRIGDQVELTVYRSSDDSTATVQLVRERIALAPVDAHVVAPDLGYILIRSFDTPVAAEQAIHEIDRFRAAGATGVILDLRGNPGGRLDIGAEFLGRVLPSGTPLYYELTAGTEPRLVAAAGEFQPLPPMAVLVDEQTASMAEIVAEALQQAHAATVIGRRTAGSVAGGKLFPLGDGSALDVTVFDVQSGQGVRLNGVGVLPDIEIGAASPEVALSGGIAFLRAHTGSAEHIGADLAEDSSALDAPASAAPGAGPWFR
jgi:carboxyl-terminal processing protease